MDGCPGLGHPDLPSLLLPRCPRRISPNRPLGIRGLCAGDGFGWPRTRCHRCLTQRTSGAPPAPDPAAELQAVFPCPIGLSALSSWTRSELNRPGPPPPAAPPGIPPGGPGRLPRVRPTPQMQERRRQVTRASVSRLSEQLRREPLGRPACPHRPRLRRLVPQRPAAA